jgi:hypothetical protein
MQSKLTMFRLEVRGWKEEPRSKARQERELLFEAAPSAI